MQLVFRDVGLGQPLSVALASLFVAALSAPLLAQSASIKGVGLLSGDTLSFSAGPSGLSTDGQVWVGTSARVPSGGMGRSRAARKANNNSIFDLGVLAGSQDSIATACDQSGGVVVGRCIGGTVTRAFRWQLGLLTDLGRPAYPGMIAASAVGISANAAVVAGSGTLSAGGPIGWSLAGGNFTIVPPLANGTKTEVAAISGDGVVIVGAADVAGSRLGMRWTKTGGTGLLPLPPGQLFSAATAVNADGSVIVGVVGAGTSESAIIWRGSTFIILKRLAPTDTTARCVAVSPDGDVIIGESADATRRRVWVWTADSGLIALDERLSQQGADVSVWNITSASAIGRGGLTFSGTGELTLPGGGRRVEGFIASLITLCASDWNGDGGIDGSDVDQYLAAWTAGIGDINLDGGVDGSDVQLFFERWSAGIC